MASDKECSAELGAGDHKTPRLGGFAKAAERLNREYPGRVRPISRQLVHKWWLFRHSNRFPEAVNATGTGTGRPEFDLDEVETWYVRYMETRGGTHKISQQRNQAPSSTVVTGEPDNGNGTLAA
jgi:hypothetical protein